MSKPRVARVTLLSDVGVTRLLAALLFGILLALAGLELYHARYAEPAYCPVPAVKEK